MSLLKSRFIEMFGKLGNHHKDWKIAKFENFCEINPNKKSIENIEDSTEVSFIPMAAVSEKGEIDTSEIKTYSEVKKGFTSFSDKDVLFAKITPCMENGKGAVAEGLKNNLGFGSTEFHVLRPKQELCDSYWLYYLMSLPEFRKKAELNMKGSAGQKRVPANFLAKFEISLPPIGLQKVYIDFFNQIDKSKFLLQQILEKFELLKKSRFIEMFGNVATNNKRWEKTKLGNKSVIGSSKRIFANEYTTEGIPFYRSKEIIELGMGEKPSVELYISKKRYQEIKEKFGIPIPGDILMTAVGTIGKFWIVPNSKPFYYKDGNLVYIRTKEFNPLFLKKLLEMLIEKYKVENANGSAYTALTIEKLKDLQIVLPPMTLQKQYEEFHIQIDKSKFNVFQDQTASQVKVIVVLHHIC